jgi:hypothetical protein
MRSLRKEMGIDSDVPNAKDPVHKIVST